jgi:hypothetical protein
MILTDNETKVDLLNNEAIAATIIKLLREQPDRPVTVGVHGDWGAGKSSILEMVEAGFDGQPRILCLKFNGWRFQGFEDAKIALIEGIVTGLVEKRPTLTKTAEVVKEAFRRIDWLKVAKRGGGLAFTAFTGIPTLDQVQTVVGAVEGLIADPTRVVSRENIDTALGEVKSLLKPAAETKKVPEEIREFRKAFDDLLEKADVERLVVLIDDLDRCLPDTAIETLEAVRLFVFTARTAFVVAADEAMIEYAVRKHFPELPDTTGPRDYARNYLEKLIQVPFRIPALGETETRLYVLLLLVGAEIGEDSPEFAALIAEARNRLRRPWEISKLDAPAVKAALGAISENVQSALFLSDQISPILASGTKGNPRQVKRFLNTLLLRNRIAEARGFGDEVKLPILAKLMLAERFLPRLFDQIASTAAADANGLCPELVVLEAAADEEHREEAPGPKATRKVGESQSAPKRPQGLKSGESALVTEWLASKSILAWSKIAPKLADVDLRPYVFVAKDRKDYFGPASVLGHLATVVEQLLGPKLAVQALASELQKLAPPEATQVFDAVTARIISADTFETEPSGAAGITVLVKVHPTLQGNLLDFLESLPRERLGPWAISGWEGVIKEADARARFEYLLETWSTGATDPMLKAAASGSLKTRKGRQ